VHKNPKLAELDAALEAAISGILEMKSAAPFRIFRTNDSSCDTPHRTISRKVDGTNFSWVSGFDLRIRERIDKRVEFGLTPTSSACFSCWAYLEPNPPNPYGALSLGEDLVTGVIHELEPQLPTAFRRGLAFIELWTPEYLREHGQLLC